MPEISRFYGIVIAMFFEVGEPHHRPHFHANYQHWRASFAIDTLERLAGELPRSQNRLVVTWAQLHRDELLDCWERLQKGRDPGRIEPLRVR